MHLLLGGLIGIKFIRVGAGLNININGTTYNYGSYFHLIRNVDQFGTAVAHVYGANTTKMFVAWLNASEEFNPDTATWYQLY